jgi:hypothetical protein
MAPMQNLHLLFSRTVTSTTKKSLEEVEVQHIVQKDFLYLTTLSMTNQLHTATGKMTTY